MANKGIKIAGITVGAILFILLIFWLLGNMWITNIMDGFLRKELGKLETVYVDYDKLDIDVFRNSARLEDVVFCTMPDSVLPEDSTGLKLKVDRMVFSGCNFVRILNRNELSLRHITLTRPEVTLHLPLKKPAQPEVAAKPEVAEDTLAEASEDAGTAPILRKMIIGSVRINDGSLRMRNVTNKMSLQLDNLNVRGYDLGYHFGEEGQLPEDEVLTGHVLYNDSLYRLSLKNFSFVSPDGLLRADIEELDTRDGGPLHVQGIHAYNTCKKGELADKKGKTQVAWIDVSLAELTTTPVSLLRQAVERNFHIDTVRIKGEEVHLMKDVRYPPQKPYPMPQDELLKMDIPFHVACVLMTAPAMNVEVVTTHLQNCGALEMRHVDMTATNVTNKHGETMKSVVHSDFGHGGACKIQLNMKMDKAAHFDFQAHMKDLKGSTFNKFLHPLFGAEIACNINSINTAYAGNRDSVAGTFCMQYDSMRVEVFKEDAPYEAIAKNAGVINFFAPMIVPQSNPRNPKSEPITYNVHATRDPQHNFPVYLIAPMMDGLMQTLLPGFVVKMIAKKQDKKQQK